MALIKIVMGDKSEVVMFPTGPRNLKAFGEFDVPENIASSIIGRGLAKVVETVAERVYSREELEDMTVAAELRPIAQAHGVAGYHNASKAKLVDALLDVFRENVETEEETEE